MALDIDMLPRFRNPPVDEVAVGVQFALPGFLPTHYGRFHERIKGDFPGVQALLPLPPQVETFRSTSDPNQSVIFPPFFGFGAASLPRVLFVSADDSSLVQLQGDRLYINWRNRAPNSYPHYAHLKQIFSEVYATFEAFVADEGLPPILPSQCDVLYVNPLPPSVTGVLPSFPEKVFRSWNAAIGEEWSVPLEDLSFNARYQLLDEGGKPFGRLTAAMTTITGPDGIDQLRLELIARGAPRGSALADVLAFHDIGHEAIVRCFAAMTTPEMHIRWGRYRDE